MQWRAHEKAGQLSLNGGQKQGKVSCKCQASHDTMTKFMASFIHGHLQ